MNFCENTLNVTLEYMILEEIETFQVKLIGIVELKQSLGSMDKPTRNKVLQLAANILLRRFGRTNFCVEPSLASVENLIGFSPVSADYNKKCQLIVSCCILRHVELFLARTDKSYSSQLYPPAQNDFVCRT